MIILSFTVTERLSLPESRNGGRKGKKKICGSTSSSFYAVNLVSTKRAGHVCTAPRRAYEAIRLETVLSGL